MTKMQRIGLKLFDKTSDHAMHMLQVRHTLLETINISLLIGILFRCFSIVLPEFQEINDLKLFRQTILYLDQQIQLLRKIIQIDFVKFYYFLITI